MDYTITLTTAQQKALEYVAVDVQSWIENAALNRARLSTDEICQLYTNYKLENNQAITATNKDDMVLAAYSENLIVTAAQAEANRENVPQVPE